MCMPKPTKRLLCFMATIVFAACGILTSDNGKGVTVSIDDTDFGVSEDGSRVEGTLAVVIANDSPSMISYGSCGTVLEQEVEAVWEAVWFTLCTLEFRDALQIAQGEQVSIEVQIRAILGNPPSRGWRQPVEGRYRLTLALGSDAGPLSPEFSRSNSFRVSAR